ncbi:MAG: HDIG domain-containing protein [Promethearchaeota archaeon]|nr:MAG: HDIG domain-containing protein [Candidatus Lokiarchaeota archaeon]
MVKNKELALILPDREFTLELLRELKVPFSVRRHSIKVAEKALEIAKKIKKKEVDIRLVEIGALVHDIGRSKTHGFNHALIGGKILRERGFPEELARICERHILGGLDKEDAQAVGLPPKNFLPVTLEEKIICLADKRLSGKHVVSLQRRFQIWFKKYGKTKILLKAQKRVEKMQKEIQRLM